MNEYYMPTPYEVDRAPELAVLAALDSTLEAAKRALFAAHPELCDERILRYGSPSVISGARLVSRATKLQVALLRYRQAVLSESPLESEATDDSETF